MHRVVTTVRLINYGIVLVNLRTLEVLRLTGNLTALEYENRRYLQNGLLVEILNREGYVYIGSDHTVVQNQDLRRAGYLNLVLGLGHLLEAIAARESQRGSNQHHAQFHEVFHNFCLLKCFVFEVYISFTCASNANIKKVLEKYYIFRSKISFSSIFFLPTTICGRFAHGADGRHARDGDDAHAPHSPPAWEAEPCARGAACPSSRPDR